MATTADDLREEVRRRYAESARAVTEGGDGCGCGSGSCCESESDATVRRGAVRRRAARRAARGGDARLARLRQPDRGRRAARGRDGARPRLGRRHRRDPVGEARRARGDRVRPRHDGRDARARTAERRRRGRRQRPLPQGRDRADPAAGRLGRRRDLELRDQSLGRQAGRADGDRARPEAGRADRDQRRRRRGPPDVRRARRARVATSAASPVRSPRASTRRVSRRPASSDVSVEFTHEVADGMHGAIVKAVKTHEPERKGLPVVQPAERAGCC